MWHYNNIVKYLYTTNLYLRSARSEIWQKTITLFLPVFHEGQYITVDLSNEYVAKWHYMVPSIWIKNGSGNGLLLGGSNSYSTQRWRLIIMVARNTYHCIFNYDCHATKYDIYIHIFKRSILKITETCMVNHYLRDFIVTLYKAMTS